MEAKPVTQQPEQKAHFWPALAAGGAGVLGGWKLFGGKKKDAEPNPVLFWSMLVLFVIILTGFGIFAYKKWLK